MKLKTRIIIAFLIIMFLPSILLGVSGLYIIRSQEANIQGEYGEDIEIYDIVTNPLQILNRFTRATYNKISLTANESPKEFEDIKFINELDQELDGRFSFIILRRDNVIIYNENSKNEDIERFLPAFGSFDSNFEGGYYIDSNNPFLLKQKDFYYNNGSEGSIFIITDVRNIVPQIRQSTTQLFAAYIIITLLTAIVVVYWLYFSIIKPLDILKIATSEITKGNLNYSIKGDPNDEIGQLCIDFEIMRVRIKVLMENQLENEKNIKEMVSNISHDLKTPITAIKGYSEGIIDGVADTPEKQEKYIETIYNKANAMSTLVNELMQYSKIENNRVDYKFSKLNLDNFFSDCIEELSLDFEVKNFKISYKNELGKDIYVLADPEQMKKVINNIINNSLKYIGDKQGLIHIEITDANKFAQISITDNGIGVSSVDLPYIFDRFYRTDKSRNSIKAGSGLGLSIAKKIVEDHGGEIMAKSEEGKGTTIYTKLRKYEVIEHEEKDTNY